MSLADLYLKSVVNYSILNFQKEKFVKMHLLSCYVSTYVIYSICWLALKASNIYYLALYRKIVLTSAPGYWSWILESDIFMLV